MEEAKNRCANCGEPYRNHRERREAAPICMKGGVYRSATEEELHAMYLAAFPEGLRPIATFRADNPADLEKAKQLFSAEALNRMFGPGGGGMAEFDAILRSQQEPTP